MALSPKEAAQRLERILDDLPDAGKRLQQNIRQLLGKRSQQKYMQRDAIGPREGKGGPIRIQTGRLARSVAGGRSAQYGDESIMSVKAEGTSIRVTWGSRVPYARVHEKGISDTVQVSAHTRTITQAFGEEIPEKQVQVSAHTRQMNMPARPYLKPALVDEAEEVGMMIRTELIKIVNNALS